MKLRNLTRLLFVVSMAGLVCFGPMLFGNKKSSAAVTPLALPRFVATTGSDAGPNDCSNALSPCATIQHAVDQSASGDTINVAAGTYTEPLPATILFINKSLTLLGAQAGVDARNPRGSESIISNSGGTSVSADSVVIDGFTIQDSTIAAFTGYGIWINPGKNGTQVLNNIFQNNIVGLGLSNGGASQALIQHNLFKDNNQPGAAFGTGIYTDQFVSGAVSKVLIDANKFSGNQNDGIGFSSTDTNNPDHDITITGNAIDSCGRGIYFFNTGSSSVTGNTITNCTVPTDGGTSVGIGIFGAVTDLSIMNNDLETGAKRGIRIGDFIESHPNTNVQIHFNNIVGFADAGLFVDDVAGSAGSPPFLPSLSSSPTFATCNWWGKVNGPTNSLNLLGSTGDNVKGSTILLTDFSPWLLVPFPGTLCGVPPSAAVTACKFYDFNANGKLDAGEGTLNGWPITINPLPSTAVPQSATQLTSAGCVSWSGLTDGQYTFTEGTPIQTNWVHSTPASQLVTVPVPNDNPINFGNYCTVKSGGNTIGFWGNKLGLALTTQADFAALTALNLVNKDGSARDFTGTLSQNQKDLDNWLKNANTTNMAYMLSAQLAAMELNVLHGFVDGNAFSLCFNGTVQQLMDAANLSLGAHPVTTTTTGSAFRAAQETLKNCLDKLNSGGPVVPVTPCPRTFAQ